MQWNSGLNAGFCTENVKPWMRVMDDYHTVNAEPDESSRRERVVGLAERFNTQKGAQGSLRVWRLLRDLA